MIFLSKKSINILLILIFIAGVASFLLFNFYRSNKDFSNQMNGVITKVEGGIVTIEGVAHSSKEGGEKQQTVMIDVMITSETVFLKRSLNNSIPDPKGTPVGLPTEGSINDLSEGVRITMLKTKENLFETKKATAIQFEYLNYGRP